MRLQSKTLNIFPFAKAESDYDKMFFFGNLIIIKKKSTKIRNLSITFSLLGFLRPKISGILDYSDFSGL